MSHSQEMGVQLTLKLARLVLNSPVWSGLVWSTAGAFLAVVPQAHDSRFAPRVRSPGSAARVAELVDALDLGSSA